MIRIRLTTAADVPLGMRLKQQAGWNQTDADWHRFLILEPEGCFVGEMDGEPVATTTTCVFGVVGWIAMVLVDARVRGRGIGTALMRHALAYLDRQGVLTTRLDATPLGQPVYEKLGFLPDYPLVRYEGVLPAGDPKTKVEPVRPMDLDRILELDQSVTKTERSKLLIQLFHEGPERFRMVRIGEQCLGFLATRPGTDALQIGPCISSPVAARLLFADACHQFANHRAYIDIPGANKAATSLAVSHGLKVHRHLTRMYRGQVLTEQIPMIWASSGPEKG